jgi:hypothetical protein
MKMFSAEYFSRDKQLIGAQVDQEVLKEVLREKLPHLVSKISDKVFRTFFRTILKSFNTFVFGKYFLYVTYGLVFICLWWMSVFDSTALNCHIKALFLNLFKPL